MKIENIILVVSSSDILSVKGNRIDLLAQTDCLEVKDVFELEITEFKSLKGKYKVIMRNFERHNGKISMKYSCVKVEEDTEEEQK